MKLETKEGELFRPQPLGVFAGPQGALLLPHVLYAKESIENVLRGDLENLLKAWAFYTHALESEQAALQLLEPDTSHLSRYNQFVLNPSVETYHQLQRELSGDIAALLEAVAYQLEYRSAPPAIRGDGEIKAYLLTVNSHHLIAEGQIEQGLFLLLEAAELVQIISPAFAARLYGEWATTQSEMLGVNQQTVEALERAISLYEQTKFSAAKGELYLQYGMSCQTLAQGQEKTLLMKAVTAYQEVLGIFNKDNAPVSFGLAQMNLALVYLALPMNDEAERLCYAIAAQSLRESLKVFTKDTYPDLWSSATLNLANVLQHANTSHPEENLWEAIALYQEVLELRDENKDPLGYARLLANQGNALAHLGAFSRAVPRLEEAKTLFAQQQDMDAVDAVESVLREITNKRDLKALAGYGTA
jgi:tetratricopeptide (TPR) repeat protein